MSKTEKKLSEFQSNRQREKGKHFINCLVFIFLKRKKSADVNLINLNVKFIYGLVN